MILSDDTKVAHPVQWLTMLTAVPLGLATSPLVRLVAVDERWFHPALPGCSHSKLRWNRAKWHYHLYDDQGYGQRQAYI
ncbi:hypothetical protein TNCV_3590741 [Trichonephila clavipes]|nr:hypothetical protein TNCV_3590741 [Trichonephila clavipes]